MMKGWKAREQAARDRREDAKVDPAIREARSTFMERREAAFEAEREAEIRSAARPVETFRAVVALADDEQLHELRRSLGKIATDRLMAVMDDVAADRARARHAADIGATSAALSEVPNEVAERPTRGRGKALATSAAA